MFTHLPRFPLATLPTPITEARGLRAALGGEQRCPRILLKRDDLTGLGLGGNKARKLEFLVGQALREEATCLVTTGAVQSNHARMTAAAARVAGLHVVLVLTTTTPTPDVQGNYLLDQLYGAEIELIPAGPDPRLAVAPDEEERVQACVARLRARGHRPYVIVVGGSSGVGALGYADGARELVEQLRAAGLSASRVYYAAGSRGTQAGLELGSRLFAPSYALHGIAVSGGEDEKCARAARIATEAARLLNTTIVVTPGELRSRQDQIGEGYGIPTPACVEAMRLLARHDGIVLDPTYTAKAMAGLIADVRAGAIPPDETVVFLHTGGVPAVFAYADAVLSGQPS